MFCRGFRGALLIVSLIAQISVCRAENWAVIIDTSVFWHNYRHVSNAMLMYDMVKDLGFHDSNIILMLAEDITCNDRNALPGRIYTHPNKDHNLCQDDLEVDFREDEVNVDNLLRLLTGNSRNETPKNRILDSTEDSNIFLYMNGHGGDEFLKFRDKEELSAADFSSAIKVMSQKKRFNQMLILLDTCQATTLFNKMEGIDNVAWIGSSGKGENSYSYKGDYVELAVALSDRFTFMTDKFVREKRDKVLAGTTSVKDLFSVYKYSQMQSNVGYNSTLKRSLEETALGEFITPSKENIRLNLQPLKLEKKLREKESSAEKISHEKYFGIEIGE